MTVSSKEIGLATLEQEMVFGKLILEELLLEELDLTVLIVVVHIFILSRVHLEEEEQVSLIQQLLFHLKLIYLMQLMELSYLSGYMREEVLWVHYLLDYLIVLTVHLVMYITNLVKLT